MPATQNITPFGPVNETGTRQDVSPFGPLNEGALELARYRPGTTLAAGGWQASGAPTLGGCLSEETPDDANYIFVTSPGPAGATFKLAWTPPPDAPVALTDHGLAYRIRADGNAALTVYLMDGSTIIKSWTHSPLPSVFTTFTQPPLTESEAASITDYPNLALWGTATS